MAKCQICKEEIDTKKAYLTIEGKNKVICQKCYYRNKKGKRLNGLDTYFGLKKGRKYYM